MGQPLTNYKTSPSLDFLESKMGIKITCLPNKQTIKLIEKRNQIVGYQRREEEGGGIGGRWSKGTNFQLYISTGFVMYMINITNTALCYI